MLHINRRLTQSSEDFNCSLQQSACLLLESDLLQRLPTDGKATRIKQYRPQGMNQGLIPPCRRKQGSIDESERELRTLKLMEAWEEG